MEFPLNQLKLDSSYIAAADYEIDASTILARFASFKSGSAALVMAFKKEKDLYGSIYNIPYNILKKYHTPLNLLLEISISLRGDLQRQVNENTKELKSFREQGKEGSFIAEMILRQRNRLYDKLVYFYEIVRLHSAIESCLEKRLSK
jgi:hypothetical protein